jgi:hypothetical protein
MKCPWVWETCATASTAPPGGRSRDSDGKDFGVYGNTAKLDQNSGLNQEKHTNHTVYSILMFFQYALTIGPKGENREYEICVMLFELFIDLVCYKTSSLSSMICTFMLPFERSPHVCKASSAFSRGYVWLTSGLRSNIPPARHCNPAGHVSR